MLKRFLRLVLPNPFKRLLKRSKKQGKRQFLILWNRGMGDIALGLYGLCLRIREYIPNAQITFLTRSDLEEAFKLLENVNVIIDPNMVRGQPYSIDSRLDTSQYDMILLKPDPTYWLRDQIGKVIPRLCWNSALDTPIQHKKCVGIHVSTETGSYYGYEKNWPKIKWKELIGKLTQEMGYEVILFGLAKDADFEMCQVRDLRGKTTLFEMISVIKNECAYLIAPDSGVLSLVYYIDASFPLKIISLWSDPRQGILKAKVGSPNPLLTHSPLVKEDLSTLPVQDVLACIENFSEASAIEDLQTLQI